MIFSSQVQNLCFDFVFFFFFSDWIPVAACPPGDRGGSAPALVLIDHFLVVSIAPFVFKVLAWFLPLFPFFSDDAGSQGPNAFYLLSTFRFSACIFARASNPPLTVFPAFCAGLMRRR